LNAEPSGCRADEARACMQRGLRSAPITKSLCTLEQAGWVTSRHAFGLALHEGGCLRGLTGRRTSRRLTQNEVDLVIHAADAKRQIGSDRDRLA